MHTITARQIQREFPEFLRQLKNYKKVILSYKGAKLAVISLLKPTRKSKLKAALAKLVPSKPLVSKNFNYKQEYQNYLSKKYE